MTPSQLVIGGLLAAITAGTAAQAAPWIQHVGLTEQEYQDFIDFGLPPGYFPISISVNGSTSNPRFAVIARLFTNAVAVEARHGLDSDEYQAEFDALDAQGFRLLAVDAVGEHPDEEYAAIWINDGTPDSDWYARHGIDSDELQLELDDQFANGMRMIWLAGYGSGSDTRFAAAWIRDYELWSYKVKWGLDSDEYQDYFDDRACEGYRPVCVSGYGSSGNRRFAGVWLRTDGPQWEIQPASYGTHGQTLEEFDQFSDDLEDTYFQPICTVEYGSSSDPRYASAWFEDTPSWVFSKTGLEVPELADFDDAMQQFMEERGMLHGALAVTKDKRLVLARGYTYGHPGIPLAQPDSLFRLASVSKPITAVAVLQLVEQGLVGLDDPLVSIPGFPGGGWTDPNFAQVTVRHLLQHRGGWDRSASFDPMYLRDVTIANALGIDLPIDIPDIINYMKGVDLDFAPGTDYAYSNFGYCLLGRVIEAVSGETYEQFVRDNVLCPIGASEMQLGRSLWEDRYPGEALYRVPLNDFCPSVMDPAEEPVPRPYGSFNIENMDAHGGWVASVIQLARFASDFTVPPIPPDSTLLPGMIDTDGDDVPDTVTTVFMWTPTVESQNQGQSYGAGWGIGANSASHGGYLPGTRSQIYVRVDGVTISVVFGQSSDGILVNDGQINTDLMALANGIGGGAGSPGWPTHDLFDEPYTCLSPACPGDVDGDGLVGIGDFLLVIGAWGGPGGDANGDGTTDIFDFLLVIGGWGSCS